MPWLPDFLHVLVNYTTFFVQKARGTQKKYGRILSKTYKSREALVPAGEAAPSTPWAAMAER